MQTEQVYIQSPKTSKNVWKVYMVRLQQNIQTFLQLNLLPPFNIGAGGFSIRASCFYILESSRNILLGFFYIFVIVIYIGTFETYILAIVNYILTSETYILTMWLKKQVRKPTAMENAHFVFCPTLFQRKNKKSISLPSFPHRQKKNKFPTASPTYLQTSRIKSTAYNMGLAKAGRRVII